MNDSARSGEENSQALLLLAQKRLSSLISSLPVGIIIVSPEGQIEAVNPALLRLLDHDDDRLAGMPFNLLFKEIPWGQDVTVESVLRWFANQNKSAIELEIWNSYEELIPVDLSFQRFETAGKSRALAVLVDVTDRYRAERLKDEFLSLIVHDIRAPLSAVRAYLEVLEKNADYGQLTELGASRLDVSIQNLDRIVGLVSELLDLERLESRMVSLVIGKEKIEDIIEEVVASVRQLAERKQIELVIRADSIVLECDRKRMSQVLCNLLANAIEHSPVGSEICCKASQHEASLFVEVTDQGDGIPDSEKIVVFERFRQANSGARRGFGLGLAISKHIVRLHGGQIGVKNNVSGGSIFWFSLPLRQKEIQGSRR